MTHKDHMTIDAQTFFNVDEFAETVSYNGVDISAVVERGKTREDGNTFSNDGEADRAEIWVLTSDVPKPAVSDVIVTTDGTNWEVVRLVESDNTMHCLECITNESPYV